MRVRRLSAGLTLVVLLACTPSDERGAPPSATAPAWPALPASFAGTLPCADCAGIATTLTLRADSTYRQRRVYLGRDAAHGDTSFVTLGRWATVDGTLRLSGGGDGAEFYRLRAVDTLRLLDRTGAEIASTLNYDLPRAADVDPVRDEARLTGHFTYLADAAAFRECHSGLRFPVLMQADYLALERAYAATKPVPNAPFLVRVRGRLLERPADLEGPREQDVLEITRFLGPADSAACR